MKMMSMMVVVASVFLSFSSVPDEQNNALNIADVASENEVNEKEIKASERDSVYLFFVGTYTGSESRGIYKYILHPEGAMESLGLAAATPNPSFLAKSADQKFLVAISEVSSNDATGFVKSYRIEDENLQFISEATSGGAHPCFISVDSEGFVLAANYTRGNVALLKMDAGGVLSGLLDLQQHSGSDITERQKGPHAHSAWFEPGTDNVIAVDLGTNDLWISELNRKEGKLVPADPATLAMEPGAGPRHLAFHPVEKWIYVVNELNSTVSLVKKGFNNSFQLINSISTLPLDEKGKNSCADIHITTDGRFLYASNRGHNSIAKFSVNSDTGHLTPLGHQSTLGETPRNFALSPDDGFLLVANQNSGSIVSFRRDSKTGMLEFSGKTDAPTPVCICF